MTKSLMQEAYEKEQLRMAGGDFHQARANMEGISRAQAKARNFFANYGTTAAKLRDFSITGVVDTNFVLQSFSASAVILNSWIRQPISEPTCECGSGSNAIGPGHSDWCRRFIP